MRTDSFLKSNSLNLVIVFVTFNYFIVHHVGQGTFSPLAFILDTGWASMWTITFILAAQAGTFWLILNAESRRLLFERIALLYIFQIYCFREADIHSYYTSPKGWNSVTNGKFFTQSDAPMMLKIIMGLVLISFALCALYLLIRYFVPLFKQFFQGIPHAVAFGLWGIYLVTSQVCDRTSLNKSAVHSIKNIEEMCELTAALFAFAAVVQYILKRSKENKLSA